MIVTCYIETVLAAVLQASQPNDQKFGEPEITDGIYIRLDIRNDENKSINAHIVARRYYGGFQVWGAVDDEWHPPAPEAFELKSEHDSCWRSDGFAFVGSAAYKKLGVGARVLSIETRSVSGIRTTRTADFGPKRKTLDAFIAGDRNR